MAAARTATTGRNRRRRLGNASFALAAVGAAGFLGAGGWPRSLAAIGAATPPGGVEASCADLLIVGAGDLGRRVAVQWLQGHPGARVVGVTRTASSHEALRSQGIEALTSDALLDAVSPAKFPHVLVALPPRRADGDSASSAYLSAVDAAAELWAKPSGSLVQISSASVFAEDSGGVADESSPTSDTPGAKLLLDAERRVIDAGGTVLRCAGLYDADRGAHAYWLRVGVVTQPPDGLINLVHYEDAALAATAALSATREETADAGEVFVVADGAPLSRAAICDTARASRPFAASPAPTFEAPDAAGGAGSGKILDARKIRERLGWAPRHPSFQSFMAAL